METAGCCLSSEDRRKGPQVSCHGGTEKRLSVATDNRAGDDSAHMSANPFRRTYELADGPPAVKWEEYIDRASARWISLLSDPEASEADVQLFMEQNPSFVPGAFGVEGPANHGPFIGALITQPRLPGLTRPVPDFMWINKQSDRLFVVLIEIEDPKKRWFNAKGVTTSDFNQALGQIAEWKAWFSEPGNVVQFQQLYWLPRNWWRKVPMVVKYVLVYGRASEFEGKDDLLKRRSGLEPEDTMVMTYDRIKPLSISSSLPCAQVRGNQLAAKWFPPTFEIYPMEVEEGIGRLVGKVEALNASPGISPERKQFLAERFVYWDTWLEEDERGIISLQDSE